MTQGAPEALRIPTDLTMRLRQENPQRPDENRNAWGLRIAALARECMGSGAGMAGSRPVVVEVGARLRVDGGDGRGERPFVEGEEPDDFDEEFEEVYDDVEGEGAGGDGDDFDEPPEGGEGDDDFEEDDGDEEGGESGQEVIDAPRPMAATRKAMMPTKRADLAKADYINRTPQRQLDEPEERLGFMDRLRRRFLGAQVDSAENAMVVSDAQRLATAAVRVFGDEEIPTDPTERME